MCMDLSLGFLFCSIDVYVCLCASTILLDIVVVVTKLCPVVFNSMNRSMAGLSVLYYFPEFAQIDDYWVGDAIQLSNPLSSFSHFTFNLSQHLGFSHELALCIRWPRYWSFSFSTSPSNEYILWLTDLFSLKSKGLSVLLYLIQRDIL